MKILKTAKYIKEAQMRHDISANYLIVVPNNEVQGTWDVVHNIFPNLKHGNGQVVKSQLSSKEEAIQFANKLAINGEKVVVDETSFNKHYDAWLARNNSPQDTPMGLESDNPV